MPHYHILRDDGSLLDAKTPAGLAADLESSPFWPAGTYEIVETPAGEDPRPSRPGARISRWGVAIKRRSGAVEVVPERV
jgi:hypothetical protein